MNPARSRQPILARHRLPSTTKQLRKTANNPRLEELFSRTIWTPIHNQNHQNNRIDFFTSQNPKSDLPALAVRPILSGPSFPRDNFENFSVWIFPILPVWASELSTPPRLDHYA